MAGDFTHLRFVSIQSKTGSGGAAALEARYCCDGAVGRALFSVAFEIQGSVNQL